MINALGLLEVKGLAAGIEAADAMLKAAQVRLLSQTHVPPGLITLVIEGDLAACRAALDAGSSAAQRLGTVIGRKEIGRPDRDTQFFVTNLRKLNQAEVTASAAKNTPQKATAIMTKQGELEQAVTPQISPDETTTDITETALLSFIAEQPQGRNITEIMTLFNISRVEAKRQLDDAISHGKLRKRGNRYSLVEVKKMIAELDAEVIKQRVRQAGIVGAGGAGFPTHVKLNAQAEIYLVNGAECEPLLKVDQQLAARQASDLIRGLQYAMKATGAKEGIIALKAKYHDAIEQLEPLLPSNIRLHILEDIYPAGDEVITIWLATGRRVPPAALPLSVGVVVNNVQTLINVARAVEDEYPVVERTLTVNGMVKQPITLTVPLGTTLQQVIDLAGGVTISNPAYINGGPMMGALVESLNEPVTKTTGGILVLPDDHLLIRRRKQNIQTVVAMARTVCEQCCLCTELCPRHLIGHELPPHLIVRAVNYQKADEASILLAALTCSECGICEAYACPVDISPMRLNKALKQKFRQEGAKYVGELRPADPMAKYRLLPVKRLVTRLDLDKVNHKAPWLDTAWQPNTVILPFTQHIGAPAKPVVHIGDSVVKGQLIADMAEGQLGVPLHASISGIIKYIDNQKIIISQEA